MASRRALVLGGYGLIGSAVMRALRAAGYEVAGVGRSRRAALMSDPEAEWIIRDIAALATEDWRRLSAGAHVVVNAAGALQDGARDDLEAIHVRMIERLVAATGGRAVRIVQISAAGASQSASSAFFRTKARGDAIIAAGAHDWTILRPTLVLSPHAYGGTALLRAAAALPLCLPRLLPGAQVQTVFVGDVAAAVVACADGHVRAGTIADLTEPQARPFGDLLVRIRRWQGFGDAPFRPRIPERVVDLAGRCADLLGHLGWRSPLRSTAIRALREGVRGDPAPWIAAGGSPCRGLEATLAALPATAQERLFARFYLALPLAIATLALFWGVSGLLALADISRAAAILTDRGASTGLAGFTAIGGAIADICLGLAILVRPLARRAALGMVALSLAYLAASLPLAPDLWSDPLGPMVKVVPAGVLAFLVWFLMEER